MTGSSHVAAIRDGVLVVPTGRLAGHALEAELKPICASSMLDSIQCGNKLTTLSPCRCGYP